VADDRVITCRQSKHSQEPLGRPAVGSVAESRQDLLNRTAPLGVGPSYLPQPLNKNAAPAALIVAAPPPGLDIQAHGNALDGHIPYAALVPTMEGFRSSTANGAHRVGPTYRMNHPILGPALYAADIKA